MQVSPLAKTIIFVGLTLIHKIHIGSAYERILTMTVASMKLIPALQCNFVKRFNELFIDLA